MSATNRMRRVLQTNYRSLAFVNAKTSKMHPQKSALRSRENGTAFLHIAL